jgi:hypothetical protein
MTVAFTKGVNIHLFISLVNTQRLQWCYMSFVQVVEMEPTYQKQNGHENLVLTPRDTSDVTCYQATF